MASNQKMQRKLIRKKRNKQKSKNLHHKVKKMILTIKKNTKRNEEIKKKNDEIEVAIVCEIPEQKHPFHHLHKVHSTVDISKICENLDKDEVSN